MYIISACLTGENCKYDGGNNYNGSVCQFTKEHNCIMICPEMDGGLPSPRPPAEQVRIFEKDESGCAGKEKYPVKVVNKEGQDVTEEFFSGARKYMTEHFPVF